MALVLRQSEVAGLLDLRRAMTVLEQTFREQSAGQVKQVAPLRFMNRGMRMVVGGLQAQDRNGLRVSVTGGGSARSGQINTWMESRRRTAPADNVGLCRSVARCAFRRTTGRAVPDSASRQGRIRRDDLGYQAHRAARGDLAGWTHRGFCSARCGGQGLVVVATHRFGHVAAADRY